MKCKALKNLFIDANVWLDMFGFSKDDLVQFSKLKEMIGKDIKVFMPEQTYDEVYRNRESVIKKALADFNKLEVGFSNLLKNYEEYLGFKRKYDNLKKEQADWLKKIKEDVAERKTPADIALQDFLDRIEIISTSEKVVKRAVLRFNRGNPPGKEGKYGDAINWEVLLESVPEGEDLYFISEDKDYSSPLDEDRFHSYLMEEWRRKKRSELVFFKTLNGFLKKHFEEIELREQNEKARLIEKLENSTCFNETHVIIGKLATYSDWSTHQVEKLCSVAINNSQVCRILSDGDVYKFYKNLLNNYRARGENDRNVLRVKKSVLETEESGFWEF